LEERKGKRKRNKIKREPGGKENGLHLKGARIGKWRKRRKMD